MSKLTASDNTNLYVYSDNRRFDNEAESLASRLIVPYITSLSDVKSTDLILTYSKDGLSLNYGSLSLLADFTEMIPRVRDDMYMHELLFKATKLKKTSEKLTAVDATAGLGEDSLILAAAGFNVKMYEYNPVIASLLKDAIRRAKKNQILKDIVSRMEVVTGDSTIEMPKLLDEYDIVYLDPMFPEKQKSSLTKKKFQVLHMLERPCMNENDLLSAAMKVNSSRIVIKRPAKGPYVANKKPDYSITGKAVRYDCITSHS